MLLAIETSCDETAAAIVSKDDGGVRVLSSIVSSQVALHAPWGGVVPNLAAREHVKNITPVIEAALREANMTEADIEAIAVTAGPGLAPALQIGVAAAKTLSYLWKKPLLPIHHIEGHIYANFISSQNFQFPISNFESNSNSEMKNSNIQSKFNPPIGGQNSKFFFPLLSLVVSGGHTELVLMRDHFEYEILGETEDDAVGEAFDKVAKMLGLPYPGGPEIAQRASNFQFRISNFESNLNSEIKNSTIQSKFNSPIDGQNSKFLPPFPRPLLSESGYRFSFSGLKTSVLYFLKKNGERKHDEYFINAVCHEFQEAALEVLIEKTRRATLEYQPKTVIIAGGVSANVELRKRMGKMIAENFPETNFLMPPFQYSLDNAAMIGAAALFRWERMKHGERKRALALWRTLTANPNLPLGN